MTEEKATYGCSPGCGDCCSLIALRGNPASYRVVVENIPPEQLPEEEVENAKFIIENMIEIPIKLAVQMNPRRVMSQIHNHFYVCSWWDQTTRLCKDHEHRPPLCRGFPFYGIDPQDERVKGGLGPYPRCSFWHAYPESEWPEWVTPETVLPWPPPANVC